MPLFEDNGISVIICCFNSAERLPVTLSHITRQELPEGFRWEVIIVNNNSSDDTVEVAKREWQKKALDVPLRVIHENTPGLSHARRSGILHAAYKYSVFCDDDNWLAPDYLSVAYSIMESKDNIGVLGGFGIAVCESDLPDWFELKQNGFAVGAQAKENGDLTEKRHIWGAGAVLRTKFLAALYRAGINTILSDRSGKNLTSGGDYEISLWFILGKYRLWYDDRLVFSHYISEDRLTPDYVDRLWKGFISAEQLLAAYKRIICFEEDYNHKGILLLLKTIIKLILSIFHIGKFRGQKEWRLQDLQLCLNSIVVFDKNLAKVQKEFLLPFKKMCI
jgi:glycosyltransferase involved in cell wall biosynthesis